MGEQRRGAQRASSEQGRGNGYIWHTTGSGKTLTSFKASTLLKDNPDIEKCLFVVDGSGRPAARRRALESDVGDLAPLRLRRA